MPNRQTITVSRIAAILKKVPEKTFRITALVPQILDASGKKVDIEKAMPRQGELNLAIDEVRTYVRAVHDFTKRLQYLGGKKMEDDGYDPFDEDDIEEEGEN